MVCWGALLLNYRIAVYTLSGKLRIKKAIAGLTA